MRRFSLQQGWALSVFFNFFANKKNDFCIFYQVNWGFLNKTGAEIGYLLDKKCKKKFLLLKKLKNTKSAQLWRPCRFTAMQFFSSSLSRIYVHPQATFRPGHYIEISGPGPENYSGIRITYPKSNSLIEIMQKMAFFIVEIAGNNRRRSALRVSYD